MKSESEIKEKIKSIEKAYEHVLTGELSNIQCNAVRALMQLEAESILKMLYWIVDKKYISKLKGGVIMVDGNVVLTLYKKSTARNMTIIIDEEINAELERLHKILKQSKSAIIRDVLRNVLIVRKAASEHAKKGEAKK